MVQPMEIQMVPWMVIQMDNEMVPTKVVQTVTLKEIQKGCLMAPWKEILMDF